MTSKYCSGRQLALAVALVLLSGPLALAGTLYVSPQGNDRWSGALPVANAAKTDGPLATLTGARDAIRKLKAQGARREPVSVLLASGTYELTEPLVLEPQDSGTSVSPITYGAMPGAKPILSGGRTIAGWKQQEAGLWVADVPDAKARKWSFRQLWINGHRATLARSPNDGYFRIAGAAVPSADAAAKKQSGPSKSAFRFKPGDLRDFRNLPGANVVVLFHWESGILRIKSIDEPTATVTFTGEFKWPFWGRQRYYLENVIEALDAPGEWYLDSDQGRIYYRPRPGEDMNTAVVVAPVIPQLVRLAGDAEKGQPVEHLRFEGLSFQHTAYVLEPEGHSDWQAAVTLPGAFDATALRHSSIQRCEFAHLGGYALAVRNGSQHNRIQENHVHDLGAGGLKIGDPGVPATEATETHHNQIVNNFIHEVGRVFFGAVGVWIGQSSDNLVAHNEICDLNYTGISCGWTWGYGPSKAQRNRIEFNYIHHIGPGKMCDMGGIYTLGVSPGTVVRNNVIHDVWDWEEGYGAGGVYPDEGSSHILIENNVIYRTGTAGLGVHYGKQNIARNNIIAFGRDQQIYLGRRDKDSSITFERNIVYYEEGKLFMRESQLEADNNVYWNTRGEAVEFLNDQTLGEWRAKGFDKHSVIADPKFVDPARFDFRLQPDSPALKLGFQPIDVSQSGLVGPPELVRLAKSIQRAPVVVPRKEKALPLTIDDSFESIPVGAPPDMAHSYGEADDARIRVSNDAAAGGKQSLKFTNGRGPKGPINPHIYYTPHFNEGTVACSFDLRAEQGAALWTEWRDANAPYRIGPSLRVDVKGRLMARDRVLLTIPWGQWIHVEIVGQLGAKAAGVYDLTVTLPGQSPQRFEKLPCDPKCRQLEWLGFVSTAPDRATFYIDNLKLGRKP